MPTTTANCEIQVRGALVELWTDYLGDMVLYASVEAGEVRTTTLLGKTPDLAAFIGILRLLADYGFPVLACEYRRLERDA